MPDNVMQVDIVSPERILFSGQATMVVTRTLDGGEVAFLPNHAPFLAALTENHTRIYEDGGNVVHVAVHGRLGGGHKHQGGVVVGRGRVGWPDRRAPGASGSRAGR